MRAAREHAARDGFLPFRRDYLTIELAILVALVLTALASYYREPLTRLEQSFVPQGDGTAYYSYHYGDEADGGTSVAAPEAEQGLAWTCDLTLAYQYGYCGFGLRFDAAASGRGIDLSRFDSVTIDMRYEGPGRSLRVSLKNQDPRYLALGAPTDEKANETSLPVTVGSHTVKIRLDQLAVAEWWKDRSTPPSAELAQPEYGNVVALEFLTGLEVQPGRHRLRIERITFQGSAAGAEAWYSGLALGWLLMIAVILLHRRKETAAWRARLLDSMRTIVEVQDVPGIRLLARRFGNPVSASCSLAHLSCFDRLRSFSTLLRRACWARTRSWTSVHVPYQPVVSPLASRAGMARASTHR